MFARYVSRFCMHWYGFTGTLLSSKRRQSEYPDMEENIQTTKRLVWFSRLLRWGLGGLFITMGILYFKDGGWPAILFGVVIAVSGFFRPRRCLEEGCEIQK